MLSFSAFMSPVLYKTNKPLESTSFGDFTAINSFSGSPAPSCAKEHSFTSAEITLAHDPWLIALIYPRHFILWLSRWFKCNKVFHFTSSLAFKYVSCCCEGVHVFKLLRGGGKRWWASDNCIHPSPPSSPFPSALISTVVMFSQMKPGGRGIKMALSDLLFFLFFFFSGSVIYM